MTVNSNALWDSSLRLIKENVEEQQYNTWFKPLVFESYNADTKTLLLQVPSAFFYEYLEENYVSLLSSVLTRCFGHGIKLTYRVVTDKAHHLTQDLQGEPSNKVDTRRRPTAPTKVLRRWMLLRRTSIRSWIRTRPSITTWRAIATSYRAPSDSP